MSAEGAPAVVEGEEWYPGKTIVEGGELVGHTLAEGGDKVGGPSLAHTPEPIIRALLRSSFARS